MEERDSSTTSSQASEEKQKFDVFLSHSGRQKPFIKQLYRALKNQGVSCFFDQDHDCLPLAEDFPPHIFEAIKTCKVALLLLSKDFLGSKWPMIELSAFLKARDIECTNPKLNILPLFFLISPGALKNAKENDEKWQMLKISEEKRSEWQKDLNVIRRINGLPFSEGDDEVEFIEEVVKAIWRILPMPSPRYYVRGMQGEARMCEELESFFSKVTPNGKGVRIAGLYGIAGQGKTTLSKAFCNFKLGEFEGRVCHLEFSKGDPIHNVKLALRYLTHRPESYVQSLTSLDQAKLELERRVKKKRVLLVIENIAEYCIEEVLYYLNADLGENSWVLLSARSVDVLIKHLHINKQSCMRVPRLEEEEAITIFLERAFLVKSNLGAHDRNFAFLDRGFASKFAQRCLFRDTSCDISSRPTSFHPLALKAFSAHLMSKYGSNPSKWVDEMDSIEDRGGDGLDDVFALLDRAFDDMSLTCRTVFMLLTVYMMPNMSPDNVKNWLAINCNKEIKHIEKVVEDLVKMAFIEEFKTELCMHDIYIEFAQWKANKMQKWLWWKAENECSTRVLVPEENAEFELAKFEQCKYQNLNPAYTGKLHVLQLLGVDNEQLDLVPLKSLRSIILDDCKCLAAVEGIEKLRDLAWLQIRGVHPMFKVPELSCVQGLQYLHIEIANSQVPYQLGDLTHGCRLREIYVVCPSLTEFPMLKSMKYLEKVEFSLCDKVEGPLDCTDCARLQSVVLSFCSKMAVSPLVTGCEKLLKLVLLECGAVTNWPDVDVPTSLKKLELQISSNADSAPKNLESYSKLEDLQIWNMEKIIELPSFQRLSNLTVLKLIKCSIREPPDLTGCERLEDVYFSSLRYLKRFPNFSLLRELKRLSLCDCISVQDPPDIVGCHKLEVFHLLYNDNMKGLPKMDECAQLEEIQVSWRSVQEVSYEEFDPDSCQVNEELEFCLEYWKDEKYGKMGNVKLPEELKEVQCVKGETILLKRYFRGVRLYYSLTSPYQWFESYIPNRTPECHTAPITLTWTNSKVIVSGKTGRECEGRYWLNKVRGYFALREDIVNVGAHSGKFSKN